VLITTCWITSLVYAARYPRSGYGNDRAGDGSCLVLGRYFPDGMEDALLSDFLDRECLAALNQYQPALSASWLFQKCMSVAPGARPPPDFINNLMGINFGVMESLGDDVMRPFLQDVVQFGSLVRGRVLPSDDRLSA